MTNILLFAILSVLIIIVLLLFYIGIKIEDHLPKLEYIRRILYTTYEIKCKENDIEPEQ